MTKVVWRLLPHLPGLITGSNLNLTPENEFAQFDNKHLALDTERAAQLYVTARALNASKEVESGTSFGISTMWLASAKRARTILSRFSKETLKTLDGEPVDLLLNDRVPGCGTRRFEDRGSEVAFEALISIPQSDKVNAMASILWKS
ncbi:hypothetical protein BJ742DRAFT_768259 [Cladochytrium replicatum]|nr:hypothetical protein BJ742DRAFT_768259 [Cladochytrium replicatum]